MVGDGAGTGVEAGGDQAFAEAEDGRLGFGVDLMRAGVRAPGANLQGLIAALAVAGKQLVDPAFRVPCCWASSLGLRPSSKTASTT